jgi:hypothetical protein
MKEIEIDEKTKSEIGKNLIDYLLEHSFGSRTKKDIDLYLFNLIKTKTELNSLSIFDIANFLKIPDTKVKNLILESGLRFPIKDSSFRIKILKKIADSILVHYSKKMDFDGKNIKFMLEDPIHRREFENALKEEGHYADTSFNKEIVVVRLTSLIDVFKKHFNEFDVDLENRIKADKKFEEKELGKTLNFSEKIEKFLSVHKEKISIVLEIFKIIP